MFFVPELEGVKHGKEQTKGRAKGYKKAGSPSNRISSPQKPPSPFLTYTPSPTCPLAHCTYYACAVSQTCYCPSSSMPGSWALA